MKIYFNAATAKDDKLYSLHRSIQEIIAKEGHKTLGYSKQDIEKNELNISSYSYKDIETYLKQCDAFIAELSEPDSCIGYQIAQAINLKKPVLVLRYQSASYEPLTIIKDNKSPLLSYKTYSETSLPFIIRHFIKNAQEKVNSKFLMIISARLERYLEWNARELRRSKAEIIRESIEITMQSNQKYKEYLQMIGLEDEISDSLISKYKTESMSFD